MRLADIAKKLNKLEESLELERLYSAYRDSAHNQFLSISPTNIFYSPLHQSKSDSPLKRWVSYISICILITGCYLLIKRYKKVSSDREKYSIKPIEIDNRKS